MATGYFFPLLKGAEIVAGLALLTGVFVPLALLILAPIALNIFLFHAFLASPDPVSIIILLCGIWLAYAYGPAFGPILRLKAPRRSFGSE